jgi:DUF2971 family protein
MQNALLAGIETINVCVCSFSEQADLLSQWRAYGASASGFAIGFSGESLRESFADSGWLAPVLYDDDEQQDLIRRLLETLIEENRKLSDEEKGELPRSGNLRPYLNRYAPILKHKSFVEGREWRIITRPLACTFERFGYHVGPSMLIPYFRLPLGKKHALGIKE